MFSFSLGIFSLAFEVHRSTSINGPLKLVLNLFGGDYVLPVKKIIIQIFVKHLLNINLGNCSKTLHMP